MATLPQLAITTGDPASVGPELSLRVVADAMIRQICRPRLYGDPEVLRRVAAECSLALDESAIEPVAAELPGLTPGQFSAATGRASFDAVCRAIDDAVAGKVDAVVTGPIQKEAWIAAEVGYGGHTELLADRTGAADVRMMLTSEALSVVLVTIHVPIADVPGLLTIDKIVRTIELAGIAAAGRLGARGSLLSPQIGVLGLNPHAGEHGLMGHGEEERIIEPAIQIARRAGWDVAGPLSPDTAFTPRSRRRFDIFVCCYHDQGLIALKTLDFDRGVNVTLGLPIVRTSVDHGTAMDLAWGKGASGGSLRAAIATAVEMVGGR